MCAYLNAARRFATRQHLKFSEAGLQKALSQAFLGRLNYCTPTNRCHQHGVAVYGFKLPEDQADALKLGYLDVLSRLKDPRLTDFNIASEHTHPSRSYGAQPEADTMPWLRSGSSVSLSDEVALE